MVDGAGGGGGDGSGGGTFPIGRYQFLAVAPPFRVSTA